MRKLSIAAAFVLVMLLAGRAHAVDTGYPCLVEYDWMSGNTYGATSLYTGTNCTGSFVGYYYFASTGSTLCSVGQQAADMLQGFIQLMRSQMSNNQKVWIGYSPSGSTKCSYVVDFMSN